MPKPNKLREKLEALQEAGAKPKAILKLLKREFGKSWVEQLLRDD